MPSGDRRRTLKTLCRSTTSKWRSVAHSPSASTPICTKSSISLSGEAVDCLSMRECVLPCFRAYRADGGQDGPKEQGSYGKVLSRHYFRAHQQHHDFIFVAPGYRGVEFLTAHGSRAEKWQAHCDSNRRFCSGSETLPGGPVWGRELGTQPPSGGRCGDTYLETAQRKDSCHRTGARGCGLRFSRSPAFWPSRHSRCDISHVPL